MVSNKTSTVHRVVNEELDPKRLENLFLVGVNEISYRKYHNYLTLVANHGTGKIVYGAEGKSASSLDQFFHDLGPERAGVVCRLLCKMATESLDFSYLRT